MSHQPDGSVRRLSAIWFADIVGYTRLSSTDENSALLLVTVLQQLARENVTAHGGRVVKFIGDAVLADFTSSDAAVRAALALRDQFASASAAAGAPSKLRIGVHVGDVLGTADGDLYGDGVNLASRVQGAADPGQVVVTQDVWHQLRQRRDFRFDSVGERKLKGLDAVWLFNAGLGSAQEPAPPLPPAVPPASVRYARIVRLALVYGVSALILFQLTGWLSNEFGLPDWVTPGGGWLLLIGFVVVIGTGWVQTRSPWQRSVAEPRDPWKVDVEDLATAVKRKRFPTLTWGRALLGGALAFGMLFGGAGAYVLFKDGAFAPRPAAAQPGFEVAILPFDATGADAALWEDGMAELVAVDLSGARVNVIDPRSIVSRWREFGERLDSATAIALGRQVGARYAVAGTTQTLSDSIVVEAKVYDTETGELLGSPSVSGSQGDLPQLIDDLARAILDSDIVHSANLRALNLSDLATPSIDAIRAYLHGVREFRRSRWADAQDRFREAIEADSTFAQAHYRMSLSASWATWPHAVRSDRHIEQALRYGTNLPLREQMLVRGYDELSRRAPRAIQGLDSLTKLYPDDVEGWFLLGEAHYHRDPNDSRFRDALQEALRLDPAFGPAYAHLLEDAIARRDAVELQRLGTAYRAVNPESPLLQLALDALLQPGPAAVAEPSSGAPAPATATADPGRAAYASARQASEAARSEASASGATASLTSFARGDSLRLVAAAHVSAGRWAAAAQRLEEAALAYDQARSDRVLEARIDSVLASIDALQRNAQLSSADAAAVQSLRREASEAERSGRYAEALRLVREMSDMIRSAQRSPSGRTESQPPARAEVPPARPPSSEPPPPRGPSAEEIAAQVVEELRSAIEREDLDELRSVWTSLTTTQASNFQQSFRMMSDLRVRIETLSVSREGDRVSVRIRTTYQYYNESARKAEVQSLPEQSLELGERGGRWVVVASNP